MSSVLPTQHLEQPIGFAEKLKADAKDRLQSFRSGFRLGELSGSLGDLGTLLPIMLSLALTGQVDLTASLIFGGLWNILTGLAFRMPMCVQPMKCRLSFSFLLLFLFASQFVDRYTLVFFALLES